MTLTTPRRFRNIHRLPLAAAALAACLGVPLAQAAEHAPPPMAAEPRLAEGLPEPKRAAGKGDARAPTAKSADSKSAQHPTAEHKAAGQKPAEPTLAERKVPAAPEPGSLDAVREKLAQKLGAAKPVDGKSPHIVRVASRATGEFQVAAAKPSAHTTHAAHGVKPTAAALAAAHLAEKSGGAHGSTDAHAHWAYQGETGPNAWGSLKPEFAKCSSGARQSPIDIRGGINVDLEPVKFDYRSTGFGVVDNGHTVQVNVGSGNSIEVLGRRYELLQFHFHRPSEERINGRQFDMVAHLVHKDLEGRLAVVAVLLDRGSVQPLIQTVWNNLPLERGEEIPARVAIDLNHLLPQDRRYYTYMGSLTTPPCSEGVLWMVMQQPVAMSPEQIDIFARLYPMNARPIQSASGRLIKSSN